MSSISSGYYYWTYFSNRTGPFVPVPKKFDLSVLTNKTVAYFISDQQPGPLMAGDSFAAIASQIRLAASVWDGVTSSDLRVQFGGIANVSAPQSLPGIDVVFDDNMPPGLLAQTRTITADDVSAPLNTQGFVPIIRSRIQLHKDLNASHQPSYSDVFFTTLVHEFGHALGLQHTMTASALTTLDAGRATTKARPLTADDIAGVSGLYPAPGFALSTGSITGHVSLAGAGVNLASVVALSTNGTAVSGMTNPDGAYRIDGIPQGQYYVYVHPLPPAQQGEASPANIVAPQDPSGNPFPANTGFDTQFFPGVKDWTQANQVTVTAGASFDNVNFNVNRRLGPAVYNMTVLAYQGAGGQVPVASPTLAGGTRTRELFYAPGLVVNNQMAPGLAVSVVAGPAFIESGVSYYQGGYLQMVVNSQAVTDRTPLALAVNLNDDLYVLPSAITLAPTGPPAITAVFGSTDAQGNANVTIAGSNLLAPNTRVLFDGSEADVLEAHADGSLLVAAPPATGNYRASVEALAADGQTSSQALGSALPQSFVYTAPDNPDVSLNLPFVAAGTDALIEINGTRVNFDDETVVGFGSSDVQVRRIWVTSNNHLLVNLSVAPGATPALTEVTVSSGLSLVRLAANLQIQPLNSKQITMRAPVVNRTNGLAGVPAGGTAVISTQGLPANLSGWTLTIGDQVASFSLAGTQIIAQVPLNLPAGKAAIVRLVSPAGDYIPPVAMQVDGPPPAILAVSSLNVRTVDSLTLTVTGLADPSGIVSASAVRVNVGGAIYTPSSVAPIAQPGAYAVVFTLSALAPTGTQVPVSVGVDTRFSTPVLVAVRN
jgi:hypothetical protein